jgi:ribosomal protein S8
MGDRLISRTLDFEFNNIGANPIRPIMNTQKSMPATMFGRSSILTLMQILTFVDKKHTKKVISLNGLVNKMQQALHKRSTHTLYYVNNYFIELLNLLKKQGYIFNYFIIPEVFFSSYLKFGYKEDFYSRLALIYFSGYKSEDISLKRIKLISKPSRQIYISYPALTKLVPFKNVSCTYILNTTKGLVSHTEALQHKIGGNLVCAIY